MELQKRKAVRKRERGRKRVGGKHSKKIDEVEEVEFGRRMKERLKKRLR